ncbi:hypothetical protein [Hyphomicrobium sp.]|uniref:hypothetical protein n=1 Tax=Hyphomicrobium sp. TaxID=82 RepID=UPI003564C2F8
MLYRFRWFMIAFSMVLALAPFSGLIAAALLASALSCEINDAAMGPCRAHGFDFGPLLSDLVLTASLGEVVFSILAVLLIAWAVVEGFAWLSRWWRQARAAH